MKRNLAAILALGLLAIALPVVRGWSRTPVTFPHDKHLAADLACDDCHKSMADSKDLKQRFEFDSTACANCHQSEELAAWGFSGPPKGKASGVPLFSHNDHIAAGKACLDCHGALADAALAGTGQGEPGHTVCFECHDNIVKTNDCDFCHEGMREGRLNAMDRDPGIMKPMSHHPAFIHDHQFQVRLDGKGCADCHRQEDFCSTCHQGESVGYLVHPRNWLYEHPVEARKNLPDCSSCHDRATFCTECHLAEGVRPEDHGDQGSAARQRWASPSGGQQEHAIQARRDVGLCAGCHDADNLFICARCHQATGITQGLRRSPHGPDFGSNVGHGSWHDECKTESGACFDCHQSDPDFCGRTVCHGTSEKRECGGD
jgi:hypothetical protein